MLGSWRIGKRTAASEDLFLSFGYCVTEFIEIQLLGPGHQIKRNVKITA